MYAIGKAISLSSLGCFKLDRIWIISALISVNFAFWLLNYLFLFLQNIETLWVLMFVVGGISGMAQLNVLFQLRKTDKIT